MEPKTKFFDRVRDNKYRDKEFVSKIFFFWY